MKRLLMPTLATAALALAACGGDGGDPEPTEDSLREAATRNAEAFLDKEWRLAYQGFTEECRSSLTYLDFVTEMNVAIAFAEGFLDMKWDDLELTEVVIEDFTPEEALVRVRLETADGEDFTDEGEEPDTWVFEEGEWRSTACDTGFDQGDDDDDDGEAPFSSPTPEPSPSPAVTGPGSSRGEAAPIATAIELAGWRVTVTEVVPDATELILSENSFNEPPKEGHQFVLVTIEATYDGDSESSTLSSDLMFQVVGPANVAYDYEARCGSIPDEVETFRDVFRGGTISGNLCWSVLSSDAAALAMYGEPSFSFDEGERRWWSLAP